jgi:hypothetical protein
LGRSATGKKSLSILGFLENADSAAAIYGGRTKDKDDYEWETERNGKHLRPA